MSKNRILKSIFSNSEKLFGVSSSELSNVRIRQLRSIGFHITKSPRYLCSVMVSDNTGKSKEVKLFIKNRPDVLVEYENMIRLWHDHYGKNNSLTIPQPIYIDKINSLLFLENVNGKSFPNIMYKKLITVKNDQVFLDETMGAAGRWLADFQSINLTEETTQIPEEMNLPNLEADIFLNLTEQERTRIADCVSDKLEDPPIFPKTFVHDQYLFRNLIYSSKSLCVVDFPFMRRGWPYYDVYRFTLGIDRLGQYPLVPRKYCKELKRYFLNEYVQHSSAVVETDTFDRYWGLFIVTYFGKLYPRHKGIRGLMNKYFVNQLLDRLVIWSMKH